MNDYNTLTTILGQELAAYMKKKVLPELLPEEDFNG